MTEYQAFVADHPRFVLEHCPGCGQSRCHGGDGLGPCSCGWGDRAAQLALSADDGEVIEDGKC